MKASFCIRMSSWAISIIGRLKCQACCPEVFQFFRNRLSAGSKRARALFAHLTASVFIGSMSSHLKQTIFVRPLSVIANNRFLHVGHRVTSIS